MCHLQITIDVSPPHAGVVHDGISGNPEIDYQQGMELKAYWSQFFDRESGVYFYQYIVGTKCAEKSDFSLDVNQTNPDVSFCHSQILTNQHTVALICTFASINYPTSHFW